MKVSQGIIHVEGREFIILKVDHSAHDFVLDLPRKRLEFNTYSHYGEFCLEDRYIHYLHVTNTYSLIGVYKELEDKQAFFRAELLQRGFNIDDNLFIIENLG